MSRADGVSQWRNGHLVDYDHGKFSHVQGPSPSLTVSVGNGGQVPGPGPSNCHGSAAAYITHGKKCRWKSAELLRSVDSTWDSRCERGRGSISCHSDHSRNPGGIRSRVTTGIIADNTCTNDDVNMGSGRFPNLRQVRTEDVVGLSPAVALTSPEGSRLDYIVATMVPDIEQPVSSPAQTGFAAELKGRRLSRQEQPRTRFHKTSSAQTLDGWSVVNKLAVSRGKETSADSHMTGIEGSPLPGTDKTMDPLGNQVPNIISDMEGIAPNKRQRDIDESLIIDKIPPMPVMIKYLKEKNVTAVKRIGVRNAVSAQPTRKWNSTNDLELTGSNLALPHSLWTQLKSQQKLHVATNLGLQCGKYNLGSQIDDSDADSDVSMTTRPSTTHVSSVGGCLTSKGGENEADDELRVMYAIKIDLRGLDEDAVENKPAPQSQDMNPEKNTKKPTHSNAKEKTTLEHKNKRPKKITPRSKTMNDVTELGRDTIVRKATEQCLIKSGKGEGHCDKSPRPSRSHIEGTRSVISSRLQKSNSVLKFTHGGKDGGKDGQLTPRGQGHLKKSSGRQLVTVDQVPVSDSLYEGHSESYGSQPLEEYSGVVQKFVNEVVCELDDFYFNKVPDYYHWLRKPKKHDKTSRSGFLPQKMSPESRIAIEDMSSTAPNNDNTSDHSCQRNVDLLCNVDHSLLSNVKKMPSHGSGYMEPDHITDWALNDHIFQFEVLNIMVSASDIVNAEKFFGALAHMTTSQLPQARLLALLGEKKKQLLADEKIKKTEGKSTDRTTESVGRAGLVYTPPDLLQHKAQDVAQRQKFVRHYVKELTYDAIQSNQKQTALRTLWPQILTDMVHSAIDDMWDSNNYMKKCLEQLEKS